MVAFLFRMGSGIPGDLSRKQNATVEPQLIDVNLPPLTYGDAVKLSSAKAMTPIATGDAAADVYGLLVRPFPTNSGTEALGVATPPKSGVCDVLKRGYINVKLRSGSVVKGGSVYVWTATSSGGHVKGGFEGSSSGSTITLANAYYTGPADADGNVEVAFNI